MFQKLVVRLQGVGRPCQGNCNWLRESMGYERLDYGHRQDAGAQAALRHQGTRRYNREECGGELAARLRPQRE